MLRDDGGMMGWEEKVWKGWEKSGERDGVSPSPIFGENGASTSTWDDFWADQGSTSAWCIGAQKEEICINWIDQKSKDMEDELYCLYIYIHVGK